MKSPAQRVRVAFVITGLRTGGAEQTLLRLLPRLDPRIEPHVLSLTSLGDLGPAFVEAGVPVEAMGMAPGPGAPLAFWRLVRRLGQLRPAVVQTALYHADLVGGLAARLAGVPRLAWNIRNGGAALDALKPHARAAVWLSARASWRLPDRIVCCSHAARQRHVELGYDDSRFEVIANGFDLARWRPQQDARARLRAELAIPAAAPVVGLVARLDPQKDHRGFFAAAGRLHRERPDVHFVLAGGGVDASAASLRAWIDDAGVGAVTHLIGRRDDMHDWMPGLDLLVSTSIGEAFPNVVGEAMACAVPCVVTDVGDSAWIVGDTGTVVPPGDPEAAARAWRDFLERPAAARLEQGRAARARIAGAFELSTVVRRYDDFYLDLARGPVPAYA